MSDRVPRAHTPSPAGAALLLAVVIAGSCMPSPPPAAPSPNLDEPGLSLADHVGTTLVIVSLSPATLGENKLRVVLGDPSGTPISGSARVSLRRGSAQAATVELTANTGPGNMVISEADSYELLVDVAPVGQAPGEVRFPVTLPARETGRDLLVRVDAAMNQLQSLRESQALTSGGFVYVFSFDYQAPDRTHYTFIGPEGVGHETLLIGTRRFDRDGPTPWSESDLGIPVAAPSFAYSAAAHRLRQIGSESAAGRDTLVLALIDGAPPYERYYRLWVDVTSLQVQRYTMMASGHYMGGSYRDFNAPIQIAPPTR